MRVCIVSEYNYGNGAANAAFRLASDLVRDEAAELFFLCLYTRPSPGPDDFQKDSIERGTSLLGRSAYRVAFRLHERLSTLSRTNSLVGRLSRHALLRPCYRRNSIMLQKTLQQFKPDVISIHNTSLMLGHSEIHGLSLQTPVFWTMHDCHAFQLSAYRFRRLDGSWQTDPKRRLLVYTDAPARFLGNDGRVQLVAPSQWMKSEAMRTLVPSPSIHLIPYGLRPDEFHPIPKPEALRALGLEEDGRLLVLAVASNLDHRRKNFELIVRAAEKLEGRGVEILALGRAPEGLRERAPGIRFLGPRHTPEEMCAVYSAADLHVIPSLIDNLPNTVIESLFCGTPVAGANVGGIPEMVVPGKTGWLFDPYNADELAELLASLAVRREEIAAVAGGCRAWAVERFNDKRQAQAYLEIFERAIKTFRATKG